jgi:hypothetical protein
MSFKVSAGSRMWVPFLAILLSINLGVSAAEESNEPPVAGPREVAESTASLNLMGYEGIPTVGSSYPGVFRAVPPPVADWVTTHCRYTDVAWNDEQDDELRYPLHLPDGAKILNIGFRVADFADTSDFRMLLRSRPWNSRERGDIEAQVWSSNLYQSDQTFYMQAVNLTIDNNTTSYWIEANPGIPVMQEEVCVYGIHVTYLTSDLFSDGFESGNWSAWSSVAQ